MLHNHPHLFSPLLLYFISSFSTLLSSLLFFLFLLPISTFSSPTYHFITLADAGADDKKRKRGEAAASDIIMHVSKSLDSCRGVLQRAGHLYKGAQTFSSSSISFRFILLFFLLLFFFVTFTLALFLFLFSALQPLHLSLYAPLFIF